MPLGHVIAVTGTDTGVGKTFAACALIQHARSRGLSVVGYKPVASGSEATPEGLRNEDALALMAASGTPLPYERINPYAFADPIAPHLAAADDDVHIDRARLTQDVAALRETHDLVIVEGAGGWQVPLGENWTFDDWIGANAWPVLMVVGIRLGCINHALLSVQSIAAQTRCVGWVANGLPPPADREADIVESLRRRLQAPLLATLPALSTPAEAADHFIESTLQSLEVPTSRR